MFSLQFLIRIPRFSDIFKIFLTIMSFLLDNVILDDYINDRVIKNYGELKDNVKNNKNAANKQA